MKPLAITKLAVSNSPMLPFLVHFRGRKKLEARSFWYSKFSFVCFLRNCSLVTSVDGLEYQELLLKRSRSVTR